MASHPTGRTEFLRRGHAEIWNIKSGQSFGGVVTLPSGSAAVDVVFAGFSSTDLIFHNQGLIASLSAIASNTGLIAVTSSVPGTGFTLGTNTGVANKWDAVIHWFTVRTR